MRIAAAQMDIEWHDRDKNHVKIRRFALEAKDKGADLLIMPEMFATGFSMDTSITPEDINGPTPSVLREIAKEYSINVVGGFVLSMPGGRPQNTMLAVNRNGEDLGLYSKIHQIGILDEDNHYDPGDKTVTFDLDEYKATTLICYDLRFPELFRSIADSCSVIMVIASWPAARQEHWDILLPARAVENQCFIIGVNRVGEGGGINFTGGSVIIDPLGKTVAKGEDSETLLIADIDLTQVEEVRKTLPFLKDRKPFAFYSYNDLTR